MSDRFIMVKLCDLDLLPFQSRLNIEGSDFDLLVESIRAQGVLEPLLARPKGTRFEVAAGGRRLRAAQKAGLVEVPIHVKDMTDEEAMDVHFTENFHRADLTEEEKRTSLGNYARIRKFDAKQIAEKLHMSYSWVVKYLPSEFKNEQKAVAGQLGGEAKAEVCATRRVAEMVQCEFCGVASSETKPVTINSKPRSLCPRCEADFPLHPERYHAHFHNLNGESKTLEERLAEKPKQVYKETGEFRRAQMSPQISKMEEDIALLLQEKGVHGVVQQREFCLLSTRPDFYFPQKNLAVYIDGPVHEGKEDRDQKLRELLTKRHGVTVLSLPYHGESKAEKERIVKAIMEA